jgi:hypothetical protein
MGVFMIPRLKLEDGGFLNNLILLSVPNPLPERTEYFVQAQRRPPATSSRLQ